MVDRFITWALTIGRFIVILTEVIALSAFLYRFSLDATLTDLHTLINHEQSTVTFYKSYENTYRNLQERIASAKSLASQSDATNKTVHAILQSAGNGITINNFSLSGTTITLDVSVNSAQTLALFIAKLKSNAAISGISIDTIANRVDSALIGVTLTITLNK